MANIEGLSKEEIKELILEQLRDMGVDFDLIEIKVIDGPKVILSGKVESPGEREMLRQTIIDIVGVDDIVDELVIIDGFFEGHDDDDPYGAADLYDEDEESAGTGDAFQSVEDGIPYIPPDSPSYQESPEVSKKKKKRGYSIKNEEDLLDEQMEGE